MRRREDVTADEIARLLAGGLDRRQVAEHLGVSLDLVYRRMRAATAVETRVDPGEDLEAMAPQVSSWQQLNNVRTVWDACRALQQQWIEDNPEDAGVPLLPEWEEVFKDVAQVEKLLSLVLKHMGRICDEWELDK